jgi:hypothetical protein
MKGFLVIDVFMPELNSLRIPLSSQRKSPTTRVSILPAAVDEDAILSTDFAPEK